MKDSRELNTLQRVLCRSLLANLGSETRRGATGSVVRRGDSHGGSRVRAPGSGSGFYLLGTDA